MNAGLLHAPAQVLKITGHERLHVGVRARGGEALVLADLRAHVRGEREPGIGEGFAQTLRDQLLVGGIGVAVHEADRDAVHPFAPELLDHRVDRRGVRGQQHPAGRIHALAHRHPEVTGHERGRLLDMDVVLLEAVLVGHLHRVAEALRHHQGGLRPLALDDRVGREGGAVEHHLDIPRIDPGLPQGLREPLQHTFIRRARRGEHLAREGPSAAGERDVGEGALRCPLPPDNGPAIHSWSKCSPRGLSGATAVPGAAPRPGALRHRSFRRSP